MDFASSLLRHYPSDTVAALLEALSLPRGHGLYLNKAKLSEAELLSLYPNLTPHPQVPLAYLYDEAEYPLGKSMEHNLGAFYILDPAAMLSPYYLGPRPGETILDYCGAPGGKTTMLSLLLGDSGIVVSNDLSYPRSLQSSQNVERLGLHNVVVTSGDLSLAKDHYQGAFDAIMLDAPCSGSAMFRKDPRLQKDWTIEKVLRCAKIQLELLEVAATLLSSGGRILYSTCSFSYEEDEGTVLGFLARHKEFEAVPLPLDPTFYRHADLPEAIHVFPFLHPGEGQFLCLLRHKGEKTASSYPSSRPAPKGFGDYAIEGYDHLLHQGACYALPHRFDVKGLSLLRYGVKLFQADNPLMPDQHLVSSGLLDMVQVDEETAKKFLRGETFPTSLPDGRYYALAYKNMPLGAIKSAKGIAKNHYPKGLRKAY